MKQGSKQFFIAASILAASIFFFVSSSPLQAQKIDRLDTIGPYLGACINKIMRGMSTKHSGLREVSFRLSFRSDGSLIGEPRRTYSMRDAEQKAQKLFVQDIADAVKTCTPLPFSKSLGGAIAGRAYFFRYKLQPQQDLRA
jgi:hypothetical protein